MENIIELVNSYVNNGDDIVVAVSGGVDSMVLLYSLIATKKYKDFQLSAITIEHGIRGKESVADAKFVYDYCKKNGVDASVVSANIPALSKAKKQTIEECARNFRYQEFNKLISMGKKVFIAHNLGDQAETVLMHIFRGSGIDGAKGIISHDGLIRPLLEVSKLDIYQFAKENKIDYREDKTNQDIGYSRNFIRNKILPELKTIYPNVEENLNKFAKTAMQAEALVSSLVDKSWINKKNGQVVVSNNAFEQPDLVVAKVIKLAFNDCGEYSDLESKHIKIIKDLFIYNTNGSKINLTHGVIAEKRENGIYFYKIDNNIDETIEFQISENQQILNQNISVKFAAPEEVEFGDGYYLDYHKIPANAVWRTRKDGDVFCKLGSHGNKKLNDYFTDKKLTIKERDNQLLLASDNKILLVLNRDVSEYVKIDDETSQIVKIKTIDRNIK